MRLHIAHIFSLFVLTLFLFPSFLFAQELHQDQQGVWRAEVVASSESKTIKVPGTNTDTQVQTITARILEGEQQGETVTFENDYIQLEKGDAFFLNYLVTVNGDEIYSVREVDRRGSMAVIAGVFALVLLLFARFQGLRSLISLGASLLAIVFVLVPLLMNGYPPIPVSIGVASIILFFAIFFTHGFHKQSLVAYIATITSVVLTGIFAFIAISITQLSGFASEEAVYLNLNTGGALDFTGLLLAAIIIGALGVLDDVAVTQVSVVRELYAANSTLSFREIYTRAIHVGKDHIGAVVNTLVLAYTGAALPLLLLFSLSDSPFFNIINREIIATEIVRTLVGSTGLILAVPIATLLAVYVYKRNEKRYE